MTLYPIILFCHLAATLVVAAALSIEAISLSRLRRSTTRSEVRIWSDLVPNFSLIMIGSLAVLLLSGGYMTEQIAAWTLGWPRIAVLGLVLIAPFGAVTGKRMRAIRRESSKDSSTLTDLSTRVRDPFLKVSFCARTTLFFGIVFLMTVRPGLGESLAVLGVSLLLGFASAQITFRGRIAKRDLARMEGD
jgi:hypothetical protein